MTDHAPLPTSGLQHVTTFCGQCSCGCPELYLDPAADEDRRVVITDDFGQAIRMSVAQLAVIVDDARNGVLDELLAVSGGSSAPLRAAGPR
ncbi:hypothetical protein [Actinomycetospora aeridis]|uniref:Uncharacterized protein n=1 Tax=Actinomycetospora aeridis TaxID=3129231 RepID=A0ABU8N8S6_9PSEU